MTVAGSVRARCLVVAACLTAAAGGAAAVLVRLLQAVTAAPRTADESLVLLSLVALLASVAWGSAQGFAAVIEAWRGSATVGRSGAVRRVVLAACGVAVVSVLATQPAGAAPGHTGHPGDPDVLTGLPLPQRAVGRPTPRVAPSRSAAATPCGPWPRPSCRHVRARPTWPRAGT